MSNDDRFLAANAKYVKDFGDKVRLVFVFLHQRPHHQPGPVGIAPNPPSEEVGCSNLHGFPYGVGAIVLLVPRSCTD